MTSNQDVQPVVFQAQSYNYQQQGNPQGMNTWSQQPPNQPVPYAIQYHGDVGTFGEKVQYGNTYPPLQYSNGGSEDIYRHGGYPTYQQTNQWNQQQYSQAYSPQAPYGSYERDPSRAVSFNPGAPLPPMNRPPPPLKRDGGENNFALSMLENPAQTAAAYTASWVSSTSSIPPDLKDEPEFATVSRDDVGNVFNAANFSEQFNNMTMQDSKVNREEIGQWETKQMVPPNQWPGLSNNQNELQQSRQRKQDENRRPRVEARELTWEERLRKAQVQKDRVEHRTGQEKPEQIEKSRMPMRASRGNKDFSGVDARTDPRNQKDKINRDWKPEDDRSQQNGDFRNTTSMRPRGNVQGHRGGFSHQFSTAPPVFPNGQPLMIPARGGSFMRNVHAPPPQMIAQDERFRNTWLDANAFLQPFPMQFPQVPYGGNGGFVRSRGRGRGRGGNSFRRDPKRDVVERDATADGSSPNEVPSNEDVAPMADDNTAVDISA